MELILILPCIFLIAITVLFRKSLGQHADKHAHRQEYDSNKSWELFENFTPYNKDEEIFNGRDEPKEKNTQTLTEEVS